MVPGDEQFLWSLADAVLEGRSPNWEAAESAASDSQRALIHHLKSVAAISSFQRVARVPDETAVHRGSHREPFGGSHVSHSIVNGHWGHLRVAEPIGHGAFATVYRAWDPRLHREVALKLLPAAVDHADALAEGRLLAKVRHPNVVTIYGADRIGRVVGFWMELVAGETLGQIIARGALLPVNRIAAIGRDLCSALAAVHAAGLVHRDIKAHNVMIEPAGRVVLMDFGTGRHADDTTASVAGTPLYLPPEVFAGAPPTPKGDQYSVGVLLYYALTRQYPASGDTFALLRTAHHNGGVHRDVRKLRPETPRRLAAAIEQSLAPNPAERFDSVASMGSALGRRSRLGDRTLSAALVLSAVIAAAAVVVFAPAIGRSRFGVARPGVGRSFAATAPTTRRFELPRGMLFGNGWSNDGRVFAFAGADGAPAVFHTDSGQTEVLTPPDREGYTEWSIAAPDGTAIAYQWWPAHGRCELHLVNLTDRSDRVMLREDANAAPAPVDWSRDGASIVVVLRGNDGGRRVGLLEVASGQMKVVHQIGSGNPGTVALSPDKRAIAYDVLDEDVEPPRWRIHIADVGSDSERLLLPDDRTNNRFALWTPDGDRLFFMSDRAGTPDGWTVSVRNGVAVGEPELVARNLSHASSLGLIASGAFYYRLQSGQFDVQEIPLDPATGRPAGAPHVVRTSVLGSNIGPSYSHDGRRLAFISQRTDLGGDHGRRVLMVRDRRTAVERELRPPLDLGVLGPMWSHDDRWLIVRGTNRRNQSGLFVIDAETGAIRHAVPWPERDETAYGRADWSADDTAIVFEHAARGLVRHRLDSGGEDNLFAYAQYPALRRVMSFAYSPDGQTIGLSTAGPAQAIWTLRADGSLRQLVAAPPARSIAFQSWLPGGDYVVYSIFSGRDTAHELWRVPVHGGPPQPLDLAIRGRTGVNRIAIDPSGTAAAFTTGEPSNSIWVLEHFLKGIP